MSTYTTILHDKRKELGISTNEYVIADVVYHLSKNGKCNAKRTYLASIIGVTRPGLFKIINSLVDKDLIKNNDDNSLSSTEKWVNKVYIESKQSLHDDVNKVNTECKQSLHLYNNINNNNIIIKEEESLPLFPEEKKIPGGDINAVVSYFYKAMAPAALGNAIKNKTIRGAAEGLLQNYSIQEIRTTVDKNKAMKEGFGKCYSLTQFAERFEAIKNTQGVSRPVYRNLDEE